MAETLTWIQHSDTVLTSDGRSHGYFAAFLGDSSEKPHYPWVLTRDDGYRARVTNLDRVKDIAELCEKDSTLLAELMFK